VGSAAPFTANPGGGSSFLNPKVLFMSESFDATINPLGMHVFHGSFGPVRLRRLWHTSVSRRVGEA
jgi:hypothetical protein